MSDKVEKLLQRLKEKQESQLKLKLVKWDFVAIEPQRALPMINDEQEQHSATFMMTSNQV